MINSHLWKPDNNQNHRQTQINIKIRIPEDYHQEPVISHLINRHNLDVNILAAVLGKDAQGDGWFDLQLYGESQNIAEALIYLDQLNIEIWRGSQELDGW